jgi:hypothetical protein
MANYNYKAVNKSGHAWIKRLQLIDPVGTASSHYVEIHFTEPSKAVTATMTRPHVTFDQGNETKSHWYLKNASGKWVVEGYGDMLDGESEIANKVVADALALNWINAAPPPKLIDDEGFTTPESGKGRKKRMQTGWQK